MNLIAIDWGSSSFRAYLLDSYGTLVDKKESNKGVFSFEPAVSQQECFAQYLQKICGDWLALDDLKIVMSGMIGSRNGWQEVEYVACPTSINHIAERLVQIKNPLGLDISIVPGICQTTPNQACDVMRGEETQIFGALAQIELTDAVICLPGTHSKWARVNDSTISSFNTFMTGEMFALLTEHSSLASLLSEQPFDVESFISGLEYAGQTGGLLSHLFAPRAQVLTNKLKEQKAKSFTSGLLIGAEFIGAKKLFNATEVVFVGNSSMLSLYVKAAEYFGVRAHQCSAEKASVAGLQHITRVRRLFN